MSIAAIDRRALAPYTEVVLQEQILFEKRFKFNASALDKAEPKDAFSKDWDRLKRELQYDGQSIHYRYRTEWDKLDAIEAIQKHPECEQLQQENLERGHEWLKESLKPRIVADLRNYLVQNRREGLTNEILWRFSQKALTQIYAMAVPLIDGQWNGQLSSKVGQKAGDSSIRLELSKRGVRIIAETKLIYDRFIPNGQNDVVDIHPIHFVGRVVYHIEYKKGWVWRSRSVVESRATAEIKFFRPLSGAKAAADA